MGVKKGHRKVILGHISEQNVGQALEDANPEEVPEIIKRSEEAKVARKRQREKASERILISRATRCSDASTSIIGGWLLPSPLPSSG